MGREMEGEWEVYGRKLGMHNKLNSTIIRVTYAAYFPDFSLFNTFQVDGARTRDGISGGVEIQKGE